MLDNLTDFVFKKQVEVSEFLLGLFSLFWGIWVLNPAWGEFAMQSSPFLTDSILGIIYLTIGLSTVLLSTTKWYRIRRLNAFVFVVAWVFLCVHLAVIGIADHPVPVYLVVTIAGFWSYIKLLFLEHAYKHI